MNKTTLWITIVALVLTLASFLVTFNRNASELDSIQVSALNTVDSLTDELNNKDPISRSLTNNLTRHVSFVKESKSSYDKEKQIVAAIQIVDSLKVIKNGAQNQDILIENLQNQVDTIKESAREIKDNVITLKAINKTDSLVGELQIANQKRDLKDSVIQQLNSQLNVVKESEQQKKITMNQDEMKLWIQSILSVIFSGIALFVLLSAKVPNETKQWALTTLVLISGFWFGKV